MPAPNEILDLIARFEQHLEAYRAGQYNETQLRRDYLDPFFKALGWDIDNTAGYAEAYRDVIHEDQIRIGGAVKAPDYCFRIGGTRKFFLEAKKPSVCIKEEIPPAYQVRRYGWNAKLPLSILSDFEEFAIYDCRFKPHKDDNASLEGGAGPADLTLRLENVMGPTGILPDTASEEQLRTAAAICVRYSDSPPDRPAVVRILSPQGERRIETLRADAADVDRLRI